MQDKLGPLVFNLVYEISHDCDSFSIAVGNAVLMMYGMLTPLCFMINEQLCRSLVTTQLNTAGNVVIIP